MNLTANGITFDLVCPAGRQRGASHTVTRGDLANRAIAFQNAEDAENQTRVGVLRQEITNLRSRLRSQGEEITRHVGHCNNGCTRLTKFVAPMTFDGAPAHKKPTMPGAGELAQRIRRGATVEDLAAEYDRSRHAIQKRLTSSGYSARDGEPLTRHQAAAETERPPRTPPWWQPWRDNALCAETDPEAFFPEKGGSTREAKAVCARCTVAAECLDYALANRERFGIFGGLSERERRSLTNTIAKPGVSMTTTTATQFTPEQRLTLLKHLAAGEHPRVVGMIVKLPEATVTEIGEEHGYPSIVQLQAAVATLTDDLAATDVPAEHPQAASIAHQAARDAAQRPSSSAPAPGPRDTPAAAGGHTAPLTRPDELRVLINTGKGHPSKRIQAAANRVIDAADRLKTLLAEDQEKNAEKRARDAEKEAARAEVARLEAQLAKAKAKLRAKTTSSNTAGQSTGRAPGGGLLSRADLEAHGLDAKTLRTWAKDNGHDIADRGGIHRRYLDAWTAAHPDQQALRRRNPTHPKENPAA